MTDVCTTIPAATHTVTVPAEYLPGAHHDAVYGEAVHHDAVTLTSSEVVTPAHWQRYSWKGGPVESAPAFPSADWQANTASDPHGIGHEGAYQQDAPGNGNADWFYLQWVPAEMRDVTTVVTEAYDEAPALLTEAYDEADVLVTADHDEIVVDVPEHEVCEPLTSSEPVPGVLCHDGDMLWVADTAEHIALGDTWECGPQWGPFEPEPQAPVVTPPSADVQEAQALDLVTVTLAPPVAEVSTATVLTSSEPLALAETGAEPVTGLLVAAALVVAGIASLIARRVAA